jgi:hypothetical protein
MSRGLATLWYKRHLMNPLRYGGFAFRLISHKLCRWVVPLTLPLVFPGLLLLSMEYRAAALVLALGLVALAIGVVGLVWPEERSRPRPVSIAGYVLGANLAAVLGWANAMWGDKDAIWEPTRRDGFGSAKPDSA